MTKLRKQRRKKQYKVNVNRKRLNKKLNNPGKITCEPVDAAWDDHKTIKANLQQMGLTYDPNASLKRSNTRRDVRRQIVSSQNGGRWQEDDIESTAKPSKRKAPAKGYVVEQLEKEAKAPRPRLYELPKGQVEYITYLMDKYGDDYKAMTRDRRNYNQETWKQLRAKVRTFMGIDSQFNDYLAQRGLLPEEKVEPLDIDSDSGSEV